jgi:hypothetical protein
LQTQIQAHARLVLGANSQIPKYQEVAMLENKYKQLTPSLQEADAFLALMQRIQPVIQAYLPMQHLVYQEHRLSITLPLPNPSVVTSSLRTQLEGVGVQIESINSRDEKINPVVASGVTAVGKPLTTLVLTLPAVPQEKRD